MTKNRVSATNVEKNTGLVTLRGRKKKEPHELIITKLDVEAALGEVYFFVINLDNTDRKKAIEFGAEMMMVAILDNNKVADKTIKSVREKILKVEKYVIRINLKQYLDIELTDEHLERFKQYLNVCVGDWIKGNVRSFTQEALKEAEAGGN